MLVIELSLDETLPIKGSVLSQYLTKRYEVSMGTECPLADKTYTGLLALIRICSHTPTDNHFLFMARKQQTKYSLEKLLSAFNSLKRIGTRLKK